MSLFAGGWGLDYLAIATLDFPICRFSVHAEKKENIFSTLVRISDLQTACFG